MLPIKCLMIAMSIAVSIDRMSDNDSTPKRNINAVLRDHDKELLAIPNVVGVYVGVIETTGKPCLKVMLAREVLEGDPPIPRSIEGYPVVTEITGEIHPLGDH